MDEKYLENLEGSSHIEEGMLDRLRARTAGAKQFARNWMGKGTGELGDAQLNRLFQKFISTTLATIDKLDAALIPLARENRLTQADYDKIRDVGNLRAGLQAIQKTLKEANPLTQPLSMWGPIGRGNPTEIIDAYRNRIAKHFDTFLADAKKLNLVPDQYLTRKLGSLSPAAPRVLQSLGKVIGRNLTGTPAAQAEPEAPEEPTAASPVAPAEPAPAVASTGQTTKPGTEKGWPKGTETWTEPSATPEEPATQQVPGKELDVATKLQYDLLQQAIQKISQVYKVPENVKSVEGYVHRDRTKAVVEFPADPRIQVKVPAEGDRPEALVRWLFRYKYGVPDHSIQYFGERDMKGPDGKVHRDSAEFWEDFMNFSIDDVADDEGNTNASFDILTQIANTNPDLKETIDNAVPVVGKPKNIDQINRDTAESLHNLLKKFVPDEERGIAQRQAARGEEPENVGRTPGTGKVSTTEPEEPETPQTKKTTTGKIEPKDQGRVGKVAAEPDTTEEPVHVDDKGDYTWKGKKYKKNSFKPPGLYKQLKKQGLLKEDQISYRDFFSSL